MAEAVDAIAAPSYAYTKLSSPTSIRLMRLLPGNGMEPLRCQIDTTTLDVEPVYEALSYVWGDHMWEQGILVATERGDARLKATFNLATYLHRFRSTETSRTFWVDSICINQKDLEERSQQVKLMGRIYQEATAVMIWLGEDLDDEQAQMAYTCLARLALASEKLDTIKNVPYCWQDDNTETNVADQRNHRIHRELDIPPPDSPEWLAFLELCSNPYFARAWTWQECFLAKTRRFHLKKWNWSQGLMLWSSIGIRALSKECNYPGFELSPSMLTMMHGCGFPGMEAKGIRSFTKLSDLLGLRRGSKCKEPHDVVYSLLGAARDCPPVRIDYSIPFEVIYSELAWQLIVQDGNFSILDHIGVKGAEAKLPSWVPDWRERPRSYGILRTRLYRASGSSRCSVRLSDDQMVLSASGIHHDHVSATQSVRESDLHGWVESKIPLGGEGPGYEPTQETLDYALRRVRCLDSTEFLGGDTVERWQAESHQHFEIVNTKPFHSHENPFHNHDAVQRYLRLICQNEEKSVIVTESGLLGMASNTVKVGDHIVFLFGSNKPSILRPLGEPGHYIYVTDCYLHGVMDGQALVQRWRLSNPDGDHQDVSWLERLHLEDPPFAVETFHIH